jgi:hypothetical protein
MNQNQTPVSLGKCPLCKDEPCRHTDALCYDEDFLTDLDDYLTDRDLWRKIRVFYYHPEEREKLGLDVAKYQDKLDRCRRLTEKRKQIEAEIEANQMRLLRSWGYSGPDFSEFAKNHQDAVDAPKRRKESKIEGSGTVSGQ